MASHVQVCHAWAHQTGKSRKGFNIYYDGATIYSYGSHFPIARLVEVKGQTIVLFTTRSYSASTGKHKTYTARACSHLESIDVEDPSSADFAADFDAAVKRASEAAQKAKRARTHGDWYLQAAKRECDMANRISELFGLNRPPVALEYLGVHLADLEARIEAGRVIEAERRAQAERDRFERQAEQRALWLAGEDVHFYGSDGNGGALIRVYGDELQTSQGAAVPLSHAIRAFRFIKLVRQRGEAWRKNGHSLRVGTYAASTIDADGTLHIGCHIIHWAEIERVAAQLGVYAEAPSDDALELSTHAV